jgi:hypothetical protein
MFRALRAMLRDPESKVLAVSALAVIAIGTLFYSWNEGWTLIQALYFCVVTLATVGYGDLHPTNEVSQLFTIAYILSSVGIIAAFVTELAKHRPVHAVGKEIVQVEHEVVEKVEEEILKP